MGMYIRVHTFVCSFYVCELCWTDNHENLTSSPSKQQCEKQLHALWIPAGRASHTIKHGISIWTRRRELLHPAIFILPSNKITCTVLQEKRTALIICTGCRNPWLKCSDLCDTKGEPERSIIFNLWRERGECCSSLRSELFCYLWQKP